MGVHGTDEELWERSQHQNELFLVLGAFRSITNPMAYASMPITTGKRYYDVLDKHGVKSIDDLLKKDDKALVDEIIRPNIRQGIGFGKHLAEMLPYQVIIPAAFEAKRQKWTQGDYMFLWYRVLEEKAARIYFIEDWQYSNGCAQEFARGIEMQFGFVNPTNGMEFQPGFADFKKEFDELRSKHAPLLKQFDIAPERRRKNFGTDLKAYHNAVNDLEKEHGLLDAYDSVREVTLFNHDGDELLINDGVRLISEAIVDLEERGFDVKCLARSLYKIFSVGMYYFDYMTSKEEWEQRPYDFHAPDSVQIFRDKIKPRIAEMALQS